MPLQQRQWQWHVMKIQMICSDKLQENVWKYKSVILICGFQIFFITKPVTIHLFIFVEKYRKKTLCLTRKYKPVCRKIIFGFGKKENCDLFIKKNCYLLSDPVVELQQLYEMYCTNENIRDNRKMKYFLSRVYMLHVSMWNSWKLIRSSCTWSKSRRLSHYINHWGWAVW